MVLVYFKWIWVITEELAVFGYFVKLQLNYQFSFFQHLAEIVKIQQIEDEFKCRSLTGKYNRLVIDIYHSV